MTTILQKLLGLARKQGKRSGAYRGFLLTSLPVGLNFGAISGARMSRGQDQLVVEACGSALNCLLVLFYLLHWKPLVHGQTAVTSSKGASYFIIFINLIRA